MKMKGQVLVLFLPIIVFVLAVVSLVLDGGMYMWHWQELQVNLDAACVAIATDDAYPSFVGSLTSNEVDPEYYDPYQSGVRGVQFTSDGYRAWLTGPHDTYLAQFMGMRSMNISVRTRCTSALAQVLPIAVQEPWVLDGFDTGTVYPILGDGAECVECQGASFAGAVIPQIWCENTNCEPRLFFDPTDPANSPNIFKDVFEDTINGTAGSTLVPIGGRVPMIDGVSNRFLVKAMVDAGYEPGDQIIVMVYNGTIDVPDPGYGSWDNLEVIYYALATIVEIDPNTLFVEFVEKIDNLSEVRMLSTSRTVPYDWSP